MSVNWKEKQNNLDPIPMMMYEAYHQGTQSDTSPCSICRGLGSHVITRNHFHGSELGACARKTYLNMITNTKSSASNKAFLLDGHLHEASILELIKEGFGNTARIIAAKNEEELTISLPLGNDNALSVMRIIGHYDGIIEIDTDKDQYPIVKEQLDSVKAIIECKSVKDYTYDKVKAGEISNEWYGQMQCYMLGMKLNRSYLIVKNRTTSLILMPIRIDLDIPWLKERISKLKSIYSLIQDGGNEIPDREHRSRTESECKFCPHLESCWS